MATNNSLMKLNEELAKKYGKKVLFTGDEVMTGRRVPLDIPAFDYVTNGGILINQNNELYGGFSSLKSWLCYHALGKFQRYDWGNDEPNAITKIEYKVVKSRSKAEGVEGLQFAEISKIVPRRGYKPKNPIIAKRVALVDMESTYDRKWGERLGIDNEGLIYYTCSSMNEAIDVIEALLRNEEISLVVLDSMSIIGSDQENNKSMEEDQMATNARLWNKAARKLRSALNSNPDGTLIAINATSTSMGGYGDPETVKNGQQWKLFKSLSVRMNGLALHKGKVDGVNEVKMGRMVSLINKKQKFGEPFRESELYYSLVDDGVLKAGDCDIPQQLITLGSKFELIGRSGSVFSYGSLRVNGLESFKSKLRDDAELMKQLKDEIYTHKDFRAQPEEAKKVKTVKEK
jgi:RecA/RadA recombinase